MTQRARTDIELIRTLASLAVVTIHVAGGMYESSTPDARRTASGLTSLVLNSASRFSVPLFFAMAGWTFLVASPVTSVLALRARILRVLVPLLSWTVIYGLVASKHDLFLATVPRIAWMFVTGANIYHFWFLYAYVPLFLSLGLLTLFLRGQDQGRGFLVAVAVLVALVGSTSILQLVAAITGAASVTFSGWYAPPYAVVYAILGAALLRKEVSSARVRLAGAVAYVLAVVATVVWSLRFGHREPEEYGSIVTSVSAVGMLLLVRGVRLGRTATRVVSAIGKASFGLYLAHLLVLNGVRQVLDRLPFLASDGWSGVLRAPVFVVATFAISLIASLVWGRVPLLRRVLG